MRIISGKAKGRKLIPVPGDTTRPILDRVKTALFDTLRPRIADTAWLDLFGGSGAVGIEALSQGARHCTFTELSPKAIETIKRNLDTAKLSDQASVKHFDAFRFLRNTKESFDIVYVAPPQYKSLWVQALHHIAERPEMVNSGGEIIVQIDPREYEELGLSDFRETSQRKYGNTLIVFYEKVG